MGTCKLCRADSRDLHTVCDSCHHLLWQLTERHNITLGAAYHGALKLPPGSRLQSLKALLHHCEEKPIG